MSFIRLDNFTRYLIILSLCFLFQLATAFLELGCYPSNNEGKEIVANGTSESSMSVTWVLQDPSRPETFSIYDKNLTNYVALYRPCYKDENTTWPSLVQDPLTKVYLARYDVDESSYAQKNKSMFYPKYTSIITTPYVTKMGITVNITDLPFPDWVYVFYLERTMSDLSRESVQVVGRTYPAPPKVCAGCFTILETNPKERMRTVRVYWRAVDQVEDWRLRFCVNKIFPNGTSQTEALETLRLDEGYVDRLIDMETYTFEFNLINEYVEYESTRTVVVVPEQQNILHWVDPDLSMVRTNTSTHSYILSWQKPKNIDAIKYYSLVWYDKKEWRKNQKRSPIIDWIYIPGNQTSIKLKMMNSKRDDDNERMGWRMSVHTNTSSSELQSFNEYNM